MADFTSKAIKESFIKLLNEKPLSEITIKAIVNDCGINRNTFYYHYQDVPALMEEIILGEFNKLLAAYPTIETLEGGLYAVMDFTRANRKAISHIYNSISWNMFENYLWKLADSIARRYCDKILEGKNISETDRNLAIITVRSLAMGFTLDWLNTGMRDDIEPDMQRICDVARGTIAGIIDKIEIK